MADQENFEFAHTSNNIHQRLCTAPFVSPSTSFSFISPPTPASSSFLLFFALSFCLPLSAFHLLLTSLAKSPAAGALQSPRLRAVDHREACVSQRLMDGL